MYPLTMYKGTILLLFLCYHPHISAASFFGEKIIGGSILHGVAKDKVEHVGDKIIGSTILGGISHAAQNAAYPFYKVFVEGGAGLVSRYFTLNDIFGVGNVIRKVLGYTLTKAGTTSLAAGTAISVWGKKRLQEQMEEINRWWIQQKLATVNKIGSGIAAGVGAGVSAVLTGSILDKIDDKKTSTDNSDGGDSDSSNSSTDNSGTTTTTTATTTSEPDDDNIAVSISKPFYAKPWNIGNWWSGSETNPQLVVGGSTVAGSSQVVIGQSVDETSGTADTSSTVTVWSNKLYDSLFGGSESDDGSSSTSGDELGGCCGNPREEEVNILQNSKRGIRSVDSSEVDPLVSVFESVGQEDPQQCLPLVLCAIHADPEGLLTPQETKLLRVFRPLVTQRHTPEWAEPWVRGARQGTAATQGKAEEANTTCRKTFPNCPYTAHHLRKLMDSTFGINSQNNESRKDNYLEINLVKS